MQSPGRAEQQGLTRVRGRSSTILFGAVALPYQENCRVENVVDTGTTSQLDHRLLHEATLKLVSVRLLEFVDQMQDQWLWIREASVIHGIVREGILQTLGQFEFFVCQRGLDLAVELRESLFDVVD